MVTFSLLQFLNCAPRGFMEYKRLSEMNGFVTWHENGGQLVFQSADCQLEWHVSKPVIHSYLNTHWLLGPLDAGPSCHILPLMPKIVTNHRQTEWAASELPCVDLFYVTSCSSQINFCSSQVMWFFFLPFTEYIIICLRREWETKSYLVKICLQNWPL